MRLNLFIPDRPRGGGNQPKSAGLLMRLAPSLRRSPGRRIVQACALGLFLVLLFVVCRPTGADGRLRRIDESEPPDVETFLMLDPLAVASAAAAGRVWIPALAVAGGLLAVCLFVPRGFCGWLCPMGTMIDVFDWLIGGRVRRLRLKRPGRWRFVKYALLAAVLAAAAPGVQLSGFVAAIPVATRGMVFVLRGPGQTYRLAVGGAGASVAAAAVVASFWLFAAVLLAGFLAPRFWCRTVCPTGAMLSALTPLRLAQRSVTSACVACGKCVEACPFDAIGPEFATRTADCTFCQTCGGACPVGAIRFVDRRTARQDDSARASEGAAGPMVAVGLTRRGLLTGALGGVVAGLGLGGLLARDSAAALPPIRPPGSVPEGRFLGLCVRCGSCLKACPTRVLQPLALDRGFAGLWTPHVDTDSSGCAPSCNNCGQVCPTRAIRPLPLAEKQAVRMGLAIVDKATCLPHAGRGECTLCAETCRLAGHEAIEYLRVGVEIDEQGVPIEDSGLLAPVVLGERCVGCGLCQARCRSINVVERGMLKAAAIHVEAGDGKEDRLLRGSYVRLREARLKPPPPPQTQPDANTDSGGGYLPDFLK
jgi:ferredoxin